MRYLNYVYAFAALLLCLSSMVKVYAVNRIVVEDFKNWKQPVAAFSKSGHWQDLRNAFVYVVGLPENPANKHWNSERHNKLIGLLSVGIAAVEQVELNFDEDSDRPRRKVSPPFETGLAAGVAPSEIVSDRLRKEYLNAIETNKSQHRYCDNQLMYRQYLLQIAAFIKSFVERNYTTDELTSVDQVVKSVLGIEYKELIGCVDMDLLLLSAAKIQSYVAKIGHP